MSLLTRNFLKLIMLKTDDLLLKNLILLLNYKCQVFAIFSKLHDKVTGFKVVVNSTNINVKDKVKYLGMLVTQTETFVTTLK